LQCDLCSGAESGKLAPLVISLDPNHLAAHGLGVVYFAQGKLDEAIAEFKTAISLDPNYANAHYDLARAYSLKNEANLAIESLQKAIELDKEYIKKAETESRFDNIRKSLEFQKLIGSQ